MRGIKEIIFSSRAAHTINQCDDVSARNVLKTKVDENRIA